MLDVGIEVFLGWVKSCFLVNYFRYIFLVLGRKDFIRCLSFWRIICEFVFIFYLFVRSIRIIVVVVFMGYFRLCV